MSQDSQGLRASATTFSDTISGLARSWGIRHFTPPQNFLTLFSKDFFFEMSLLMKRMPHCVPRNLKNLNNAPAR